MRGLDYILGTFGLRRQLRATGGAPTTSPRPSGEHDRSAAAYPPVDPGIPALTIDAALAPHQDLIERIRICYGVDHPIFEREILTLIRRYAEFVHLLPATADNYFNAPGGLLRMGLEVGFFSLQGSDGHIFSGRATITTRRHLEPRWRHATFIAGLCCEMHRTLCHVIVTDERGDEWQPYLSSLRDWLTQHGTARYYLKWRPNVHENRNLGIFALPHVVSGDLMQHLASGNSVVVPHMMACISGMPIYQERNILDDLVRRSVALVIDRYLLASADRYGKPQLGSHLERYLVDALRRLVASNSGWMPNAEKSRVWYGSDGLFIVWPNAAAEVRTLLESDQLPGIPKAPETMLEILLAAGVFEPQGADQATWQIAPPGAKAAIEVVKLSSPAILFAGVHPAPAPLAIRLVRPTGSESATVAASVPVPDADTKSDPPAEPRHQLTLQLEADSTAQVADAVIPSCERAEAGVPPKPGAAHDVAVGDASRQHGLNPGPIPATIKLNAPLRLNPKVRDVISRMIDIMNRDPADASGQLRADGLFIPLAEFERPKIEPSFALRALAEVDMLAAPAGSDGAPSQTTTRDMSGRATLGLMIDPRFIGGLDSTNGDEAGGNGRRCVDPKI